MTDTMSDPVVTRASLRDRRCAELRNQVQREGWHDLSAAETAWERHLVACGFNPDSTQPGGTEVGPAIAAAR